MRGALAAAALLALLGCGRDEIRLEPAANPAAAFTESADPVLVSDPGSGDLLAGFVARGSDSTWRLYFARSGDDGQSWSEPAPVTTDSGEIRPHGEASPRLVAAPGGRVAFVWSQDFRVEGRKWPASRIRFSRSLDGGTSWSPPVTLNDDSTDVPRGHTFHGATWAGGEGIVAAWLDERKGGEVAHEHGAEGHGADASAASDATIYTTRSADFGATWSPNQPLWGAACPCCRVSLARGADGSLLGAWRKHYPGDVRDVVVAALPDTVIGELEAPSRVHPDEWVYPGCPHTGPALAMGADGTRHVSWYTGRPGGAGIYLARGDARGNLDPSPIPLVQGRTLPAAHSAVEALPDNASLAAWDVDEGGEKRISVARVRAGGRRARGIAVPGTDGASYPELAGARNGTFLLAWTALTESRQQVGMARVVLVN